MNDDEASELAHSAKGMVCNIINAVDICEMENLNRMPDVIREMLEEIRTSANDVIDLINQLRDHAISKAASVASAKT
jgi:hypothetical protein